jgi:lysophospholipase L1-like esterase
MHHRHHPHLWGRRLSWLLLLPLAACGGGGGSSSGPSGPSGPTDPTYSLSVTVYYDENANGTLDPMEAARVPGVEVEVGTGTGVTASGTGIATVTGILEGSHEATVQPGSLPAYYQFAGPVSVQVPQTTELLLPVALPIGNNRPNVYLAFGDSITDGEGSSDGQGYAVKLLNLLGPHFGRADVQKWGRSSDTSLESAGATGTPLRAVDPAYTLILFGTNDWHDSRCKDLTPECFTIDALRSIVQDVKNYQSLPVLGTLPPVNPDLAPASRNEWVETMNEQIKVLAQREGALLADLHAAFSAQPSLPALFADDVHPNDAGFDVIAQAWFDAISQPRSAPSSSRRHGFDFSFGGF